MFNFKKSVFILALLLMAACNQPMTNALSKSFIHAGPGYSKAVIVSNGNTKTIYISGLTGDGLNLEDQIRSVFANIKIELEASGATFKDIVKMNTYIVNYQPYNIILFRSIRKEILGETAMPASTIVGVQALAANDKMIEIEAVAVVQSDKAMK